MFSCDCISNPGMYQSILIYCCIYLTNNCFILFIHCLSYLIFILMLVWILSSQENSQSIEWNKRCGCSSVGRLARVVSFILLMCWALCLRMCRALCLCVWPSPRPGSNHSLFCRLMLWLLWCVAGGTLQHTLPTSGHWQTASDEVINIW